MDDDYNGLTPSPASLSTGEKLKMVRETNDLFVKIMKNLEQVWIF